MNISILFGSFKYLTCSFKLVSALASWINITPSLSDYYSFSKFERSLELEDYEVTKLLLTFIDNNVDVNKLLATSFDRRYKYLYTRIKLLLQAGADAYESILIRCCRRGFVNIVKLLIQYGADIEDPKLLIDSVKFNQYRVFKVLVEHGADAENPELLFRLPNHVMSIGVEIKINDMYYVNVIYFAVFYNRIEIVKMLLENRFKVNYAGILYEAVTKNYIDLVRLLLQYNICNNIDYALLATYTQTNNIEMFKLLLDLGANVHAVDNNILETNNNVNYNIDMFKLLLNYGVNLHSNNERALKFAYSLNRFEKFRLLLEFGADVHVDNDQLLIDAVKDSKTNFIKILLEFGANVNAQKCKALFFAVKNYDIEIVKLLLDHGADVCINDSYILRKACVDNYIEVAKLLLEAGANLFNDTEDVFLKKISTNDRLVKLLLQYESTENELSQ